MPAVTDHPSPLRRRFFRILTLATVVAGGIAVDAAAGVQTVAAAKPVAPVIKGFRAEFLAGLTEVEDKLLDLAETIPAEKYNWRPVEGVRSVSEVFMHVAGGNYFLATFVGVKPPASMPKDIEKITDKAKVIAELQRSFDHVRNAARATRDADLERRVRMFGNDSTYRGVYITVLNHLHEHLGQSIAYARMNGIVPPWNR